MEDKILDELVKIRKLSKNWLVTFEYIMEEIYNYNTTDEAFLQCLKDLKEEMTV